jgi:molecular chaperone DnaJ
MPAEDFYTILQVAATATQEEIKLAYRKAVVRYHPDLHKNDADANKKMGKINEAYETLGDPAKRSNYDGNGLGTYAFSDFFTQRGAGGRSRTEGFYEEAMEDLLRDAFGKKYGRKQEKKDNQGTGWGSYFGYFEELFEDFFNKKATSYEAAEDSEEAREENTRDQEPFEEQPEKDVYAKLTLTAAEATKGTKKNITLESTEACQYCDGTGTLRQGYLTRVCDFCEGTGQHKKQRGIKVTIPGGVKTGTKVRIAGRGKRGEYGEANGDLYLTLTVKA